MKKIFITRKIPEIGRKMLEEHFEVRENSENRTLTEEELISSLQGMDGVLCTLADPLTRQVLERLPTLRAISSFAIGLDNIDTTVTEERGITVFNTPDAVTNSTADLTFALLLALVRKIPQADKYVRENKWKGWDPELLLGEELAGKNFGIVGYGRTGRAVARRAHGFGMNPIVYHYRPIENLFTGAVQKSWDSFLESVDYLSLHVPLTEQTRGMINYESFLLMKRRPVIINMARGPIIITDDLVRALDEGLVRGAALDVTDPEPLSGTHPICKLENVIFAPHIGTGTVEARAEMARVAAVNLIKFFNLTK